MRDTRVRRDKKGVKGRVVTVMVMAHAWGVGERRVTRVGGKGGVLDEA